jgi:D-serine deaminase-like pyridoxal phosphate-dependent protein
MQLELSVPTLLLDKKKCLANIKNMTDKANRHGLIFRPHFKTHQSIEIGRWFKEHGVQQITVSSIRMAAYFAEDNWQDITVAFPTNILEIDAINQLAGRIQLNLCVENIYTAEFLHKNLNQEVGIFIKINAGNNRSGLILERKDEIDRLVTLIKNSSRMSFQGFLGHAGQSYRAREKAVILDSHEYSKNVMAQLRSWYKTEHANLTISLGDTPTCSVAEDFTGIDEIRPGNFVYYDLTQYLIGSCQLDQIAVAMACPVVAKAPERNEIVIYGGGIHLSKDRVQRSDGTTVFGMVADWVDNSWKAIDEEATFVRGLSQEHGVIRTTAERLASAKIGDLIPILPVHSCMAADLMKEVHTLEGEHISMLRYV